MRDIDFVIITGVSGAGKSAAIKCFEDLGFFCIDNLPTTLIPKFVQVCTKSKGRIKKIALGIDVREGRFLNTLFQVLGELHKVGIKYRILFLDAQNKVLIRRYSETRRLHPLGKKNKTILESIVSERSKLSELNQKADMTIDTSNITTRDLKQIIIKNFLTGRSDLKSNLTIQSFGYKYGIPLDADLVFDVRFLPNPQYIDRLRPYTGNDKNVKTFVLKQPVTKQFLNKLTGFLKFIMPNYIKEGKSYLTIAIGCTGGRHRSVVITNALCKLLDSRKFDIQVRHRDLNK